MTSERKPPRRTAERILDHTLGLFNRHGEPHVSTTLISAELSISPGNLYYHFPAKEALVNALMDRYEAALAPLLDAPPDTTASPQGLGALLDALMQLNWDHRFLFRDLCDLMTRNRQLEIRCQQALARQHACLREQVGATCRLGSEPLDTDTADALSTTLMVLLTHWLAHAFARDPRHALESDHRTATLRGGQAQIKSVLEPYLTAAQRRRWAAPGAPSTVD